MAEVRTVYLLEESRALEYVEERNIRSSTPLNSG
jgi:hypothetical protein